MAWNEDYCETLCPVYEALGGDCADLGCIDDGNGAGALVSAKYNDDGLPSTMTDQEKCELKGDLNSLETQLSLPGNTLQFATTGVLTSMIAAMRTDIGPLPSWCNN